MLRRRLGAEGITFVMEYLAVALGVLLASMALVVTARTLGYTAGGKRRDVIGFTAATATILGMVTVVAFLVTNSVRSGERPQTSVTIVSPRLGDLVPQEIRVLGVASNLDQTDEVWILVYPESAARYYPQTGPASFESGGAWSSSVIFVGGRDEGGEHFRIIAVVANNEASSSFERYLAKGIETGSFPGLPDLPAGVTAQAAVKVTRRA
jgi:hypothetical protein